ncbi:MAG: hypothetical protein AAF460_08425 [Pseudomonadota bacterium]
MSDFIEMLRDFDGDMPILTPSLGTPTVRSVLGKVVIRENDQPVVYPSASDPDRAH